MLYMCVYEFGADYPKIRESDCPVLIIFSILQEWINEGMPLSTQSNEAAKLYDAAITQYIGWYDDVNVNGLGGSLDKMLQEDPHFSESWNAFAELCNKLNKWQFISVGGKALKYGLELLSTGETPRVNKELADSVNELVAQVASVPNLNYRERKHVEAVVNWSKGDLIKAAQSWEDALIQVFYCPQNCFLQISIFFFIEKVSNRYFGFKNADRRLLLSWKAKAASRLCSPCITNLVLQRFTTKIVFARDVCLWFSRDQFLCES